MVALRLGLRWRFLIVLVLAGLLVSALSLVLAELLPRWLAPFVSVLLALPVLLALVAREVEPLRSLFRALAGTVTSYRDGDFAFGIHWTRNDELRDLVAAHNALGDTLRAQRLTLAQRELLLDTMVQNTPVAMLLFDANGFVIYANLAARRLLRSGRKVEGLSRQEVLSHVVPELAEALNLGGDGLFTVAGEGSEDDQVFHLSRRVFRINARPHELLLLRGLSQELRRQEVATWKKVIRLISHELNNSLAPIASMAHSGAELARRGQHERIPGVFASIEERARHLDGFIRGYAQFAKLPTPRVEAVAFDAFVDALAAQVAFRVAPSSQAGLVLHFDAAQLQQALINLIKNALEAGCPAADIELGAEQNEHSVRISVSDRGSGMSDEVMAQALAPFYSTKRGGTGLGLALVREIVEAHGGQVALANREGGGLIVSLTLPRPGAAR